MMTSPHVLLTGFEPFGGEVVNPSWEVARALDGRRIAGHRIDALRLPVAFDAAIIALRAAVDERSPVLVLALGQAGGRARLSLERVAINLVDARIPDNAGLQPIDQPVLAGAPNAYFTNLPVKAMRAAIDAVGIPAELSHSAGYYVCNAVFFALMHALQQHPRCRGGFMHLPWLPEQASTHGGEPALALELMTTGVLAALRAAVACEVDLRTAGGETH